MMVGNTSTQTQSVVVTECINPVRLADESSEPGIESLDLSLYPNPSNGLVTINFDGLINSIQVVDMLGRSVPVYTNVIDGTFDVSRLETGKYMVQISTNNSILMEQIVVAH